MYGFEKHMGPRRLMKKGITLIFVGHINLLLGAIVHGSILRHISKPNDQITTEYSAANIISVTSGLLSIATGIIAVLVSKNLTISKMHVSLLVLSFMNALLSTACCVGLLLAISLTIKGNGLSLMVGCNSTGLPISPHSSFKTNCPFDTTRIYDTTLALWFPSALLAAVEAGLSIWCFIVGLTLRGLGPCMHTYLREQFCSYVGLLHGYSNLALESNSGSGFPSPREDSEDTPPPPDTSVVGGGNRQLEEEAMAIKMRADPDFIPQDHQLIGPQSVH